MRPLPSEVIASIRRILKETIEPELNSAHARSRLAEVRAVLAQVDWDDAGFTVAARNRELAAALDRIAAWCADDQQRRAAFPAIPAVPADEETLAGQQAAYERLAATAVAVVDPLETWLVKHPDDARARGLRRDLLASL
jgi:hypothetical protein